MTPRALVMLPAVIEETRQEGGLEPGEMTIYVRWNNHSPQNRRMNMNAIFARTERVDSDEPDDSEEVAVLLFPHPVLVMWLEQRPARSAAERDLTRRLDNNNIDLEEAEAELARVYDALDNTEARFGRLYAENKRLIAKLQLSRDSITTTAAATAIANANAAGTAAGTAAAAAVYASVAADAAAAAASASAAGAASATAAPGTAHDTNDPNTHDNNANATPTHERSKLRFFSPPNTMHDKLSSTCQLCCQDDRPILIALISGVAICSDFPSTLCPPA